MIAVKRNLSIDVSLAGDNQGRNNVLLSLSGGIGPVICISLEQARCLALELIEAVHRAEVRLSLDKSGATHNRPEVAKNNVLQLG